MSAIPQLRSEDISDEVGRYFETARDHSLIALYGAGREELLTLTGSAPVPVVPVAGELELRRRLLDFEEPDARAVFLVPFRHDLPMDLAGRFALGGRVRIIGKSARLKRLFDVRNLADDALASPLADYLLSHAGEISLRSGELLLTEARMWEVWLARGFGLDASAGLALDSLMAWAALDGRGAGFAAAMAEAPEVDAALATFLTKTLGPAGVVVMDAWRAGKGERTLQHALLFEALRGNPAVGLWVRVQVRNALGAGAEQDAERIVGQLGEAVSTALPLYAEAASRDHKAPLRVLFERAEALADDDAVRAALVGSSRLPRGWRLRLDAVGTALAEGAKAPSAAVLSSVLAAKKQLEAHASYLDEEHDQEVQRAEMAVRLLAWLASDKSALEPGTVEPPHKDVERLGRWYAEQGGFVDWARRVARGGAASELDRGVQAVVRAADVLREQYDLRFARALPAWVSASRPAHEVLPIEQVAKRVIAPFLSGHEERKLLVLLLDGMAWAQAVEIIESLGERADGWGVAAWHASGRKHKLGDARTPVVLAALPTVTEVSRAAFFAGKPMPAGKAHKTEDDPERFRDNKALTPFFAGSEYPRLFLRGEGHEAHGVASREALTAIAQSDQKVVAVVINAIDASLKGDTQHWHPWKAHAVRSLPELLQAAKEHGRSVLLASDHGHVPADRFAGSAGPLTGGARWRPLERESDPVQPCEVKLAGEGVWSPKGAEAVALLADDTRRYGGGAHAGEHGGATLAEVIAPCVLIHWDDPHAAQIDPDRAPQGLALPDWWVFDVTDRVPASATGQEPSPQPKRRRKSDAPSAQLALGVDPAPPVPPAPPAPARAPSAGVTQVAQPELSATAKALAEVPVIKALAAAERKELLQAVDYLIAREGIAQLSAFASHLGLPPFRVQGFIARRMQKVLNLDGFQVVTYDQSQVRLDKAVLAQQFGVSL
jgi:hypothetical protein